MEKKRKSNNYEIIGNISSKSDVKQKSNGKEYMYINIAQNSKDGKVSYYPVYLDGKMLEEFRDKDLKVGDRIYITGKLESYSKDGKISLQIRPFEMEKIEYEKKQENTKSNNQEQSNEIGL